MERMHRALPGLVAGLLVTVGAAPSLGAQDRSEAIELPRHEGGRYFLIDARGDALKEGHGLLVVLPGGAGTADFLPFVENGMLGVAPEDFVGAMVTSVRWTEDQEIVWPTQRSRIRGMKYSTEDYVAAVVDDVARRTKIDRERVFLLAWSSSGPAAYEIALARRSTFAGFYVAMSVFKPQGSALARVKGRRFVLDQSPEDQITPFRFAAEAHEALAGRGAEVWLRTYAGGHGWHDAPIPRIRDGLRWLASDEPAPEFTAPEAPADGDNLLRNGGFEDGTRGWLVIDNSNSMRAEVDRGLKQEGAQALYLHKTGAMPLDLVRQNVDLTGYERIQASAQVRCAGAKNTFVKFFVYDADDNVLNKDVDLVQLRGDLDWERVSRSYDLPDGAKYGVFMVVMVLAGEVWIDDVRVVGVE